MSLGHLAPNGARRCCVAQRFSVAQLEPAQARLCRLPVGSARPLEKWACRVPSPAAALGRHVSWRTGRGVSPVETRRQPPEEGWEAASPWSLPLNWQLALSAAAERVRSILWGIICCHRSRWQIPYFLQLMLNRSFEGCNFSFNRCQLQILCAEE